jgi:hypothetical protein
MHRQDNMNIAQPLAGLAPNLSEGYKIEDGGQKMIKQSEAARIPGLLAARQPRPVWEEVTIGGIRMLVILGNDVDTVIRYNRNGAADMPQLASYPDVAESAAHADERLAKQRASGRAYTNTTGEGNDWPRHWKLAAARTAGKIWYAGVPPTRAKTECKNVAPKPQSGLPPTVTVEELLKAHAEYKDTVPNNYAVTMGQIEKALAEQNADQTATAVAEWVKDLNREYYRWNPEKRLNLREILEPLITAEMTTLLGFRSRSIVTLTRADEPIVRRLFDRLRPVLGPVGTGKALHVLAPNFFPLWDSTIASDFYGVSKDATGYYQFMMLVKQQVAHLPNELRPCLTALKAIDENNYLRMAKSRKRF